MVKFNLKILQLEDEKINLLLDRKFLYLPDSSIIKHHQEDLNNKP